MLKEIRDKEHPDLLLMLGPCRDLLLGHCSFLREALGATAVHMWKPTARGPPELSMGSRCRHRCCLWCPRLCRWGAGCSPRSGSRAQEGEQSLFPMPRPWQRPHGLSSVSGGDVCKLTKGLRKPVLICASATCAIAVSSAPAQEASRATQP